MARVTLTGFEKALSVMSDLPLEMRGPAIKAALRKAGQVVARRAKQLVPPPGYPGDKPEFKPLRDTLGVEVKGYESATVAIVGPKRPAGAHGHLVEGADSEGQNIDVRHHSRGQPTGTVLVKQPFVGPAAKQTEGAQRTAIEEGIRKATEKALR